MRVLIPDGHSPHARKVVQALASGNESYEIFLLVVEENSSLHRSRYIQKQIIWSGIDCSGSLVCMKNIIQSYDIDFLFPVDIEAIRFCIENKISLADCCLLSLLPGEKFETANSKLNLSKHLTNFEIAHPKSRCVFPGDKVEEFFSSKIIKPLDGCSGEGVALVKDRCELNRYFSTAEKTEKFIFQDYIESENFGINLLCRDGEILAYTAQRELAKSEHMFAPSQGVEIIDDRELYNLAVKLSKSLCWSGVAQIDVLKDKMNGQYYVLEINPRFWGSMLASLYSGVNFPELMIFAATGKEIKVNAKSIRFYFPSQLKYFSVLVEVFMGKATTSLGLYLQDYPNLLSMLGRKLLNKIR